MKASTTTTAATKSSLSPLVLLLAAATLQEKVAPVRGCGLVPGKDPNSFYLNDNGTPFVPTESVTSDPNLLVVKATQWPDAYCDPVNVYDCVDGEPQTQDVTINLADETFFAGLPDGVTAAPNSFAQVDQRDYTLEAGKDGAPTTLYNTLGTDMVSFDLPNHDDASNPDPLWWVSPALRRVYVIFVEELTSATKYAVVNLDGDGTSPGDVWYGTIPFGIDPNERSYNGGVSVYDDIKLAKVPHLDSCYPTTAVYYDAVGIYPKDVQNPNMDKIVDARATNNRVIYDVSSMECLDLTAIGCSLTVRIITVGATEQVVTKTIKPPSGTALPEEGNTSAKDLAACVDLTGNVVDINNGVALKSCEWVASNPDHHCVIGDAALYCPRTCNPECGGTSS